MSSALDTVQRPGSEVPIGFVSTFTLTKIKYVVMKNRAAA